MTKAYEITTWAGKKHVVFGDTFRDAMMYNNKLGLDEVKSSKEVDIKTVKTANVDITA